MENRKALCAYVNAHRAVLPKDQQTKGSRREQKLKRPRAFDTCGGDGKATGYQETKRCQGPHSGRPTRAWNRHARERKRSSDY